MYHDLEWKKTVQGRDLFITFDDGPIPEITPEVLRILKSYEAKATFFCIGDNVQKHPAIFEAVKKDGHAIGNHTFNHLNGWKTNNFSYFRNAQKCQQLVQSDLFRPPYGKITFSQARALKKRYRIIMWDVLSADFDTSISYEKCYRNVVDHAVPGSIIVFHDSLKAADRMLYALPRVLDYFSKQNYAFKSLV